MRALAIALLLFTGSALADFEPYSGQPGKDVIWVPTPPPLVEKMLDMARVTPEDYVIDLGSGDGRNVIAAAKRGARALGVEYNADMVALSRRNAEREGVAGRATFVQGDMFEADLRGANVLALFLLPDNLRRLAPKFAALPAGTRIVNNGYEIPGWEYDAVERVNGNCTSWCTAYLYLVPADVAGTWRLGEAKLRLEQSHRTLTGTFSAHGKTLAIAEAQISGDRIRFSAGMARYEGRVRGDAMQGRVSGSSAGHWKATRKGAQKGTRKS